MLWITPQHVVTRLKHVLNQYFTFEIKSGFSTETVDNHILKDAFSKLNDENSGARPPTQSAFGILRSGRFDSD